jgi:hypothetical protein
MTPEQEVSHARELLNNPLLRNMLDAVERTALVELIGAAPQDHDKRQQKAAEIRAIRDFLGRIESIVDNAQPRQVRSIA